ncbi:MAG: cytochrome c1 [Henriciella sp.]|nr:cytochrome c1 [Hyphomonadaceae bacterium]
MKFLRPLIIGLGALAIGLTADAAGGAKKSKAPEGGWPFAKVPAGQLDQQSMQRGFQVYKEVCASCHGMKLLSYRNLGEPGGPFYDDAYPNANDNPLVKAIAAEYEVMDATPDEFGDPVFRPAIPADTFREPYPNEQAARAANGGALPPDLSVITKARGKGAEGDGASYVYSLMKGYPSFDEVKFREEPNGEFVNYLEFDDGEKVGELIQPIGVYYNPYFAGDTAPQWSGDPRHKPYGGFLAMPAQLPDGRVEYMDGTEATTAQMAYDVAMFLHWAGDPKQVQRKSLALPVMIYLVLLSILLWFSYKRIWRNVAH